MKLKIITTAALIAMGSLLSISNAIASEDTPPPPPPPGEQGPGGPKGGRANAEQRIKMMVEQLGLSEEQKAQLAPLVKAEIEEMKALRKDGKDDREKMMEQVKAIRESYKTKIHALLTPEQITKLKEFEKNRPGRGDGPRGERRERRENKKD